MTNTLSQLVASEAAKPISMPLDQWLKRNHFPVSVQVKFDGVRVWLIKSGSSAVIATRHNGVYTTKEYPDLLTLKSPKLPAKLILDCEWLKDKNMLVVFDIINNDDIDARMLSFTDRYEILRGLAPHLPKSLLVAPTVTVYSINEVNKLFKIATDTNQEGIVVKNPSSSYFDTGAWLKIKKHDTFDVWVTGQDPDHEHPTYFISCYNQTGQIIELGKVGSFIKGIDHSKIKNGTVLEVQFQQITTDKRLRHPFVIKIRDDKIMEECINIITLEAENSEKKDW